MKPDYADFVAEKQKVRVKAQWFDVKYLVRTKVNLKDSELHVTRFNSGSWNGWLIDFHKPVDVAIIQRSVAKCVRVGERSIFIGIVE